LCHVAAHYDFAKKRYAKKEAAYALWQTFFLRMALNTSTQNNSMDDGSSVGGERIFFPNDVQQ
jgi:hypothetical protein